MAIKIVKDAPKKSSVRIDFVTRVHEGKKSEYTLLTQKPGKKHGPLLERMAELKLDDKNRLYRYETFTGSKNDGVAFFVFIKDTSAAELRLAIAEAVSKLSKDERLYHMDLTRLELGEEQFEALFEGALLADYRYQTYKKDKVKDASGQFIVDDTSKKDARSGLLTAKALAAATELSRDLVNETAWTLTPERFAETAQQMADQVGLGCEVLDENDLEKEGFGLLLAVARAASPYSPPRVVRLEYTPKEEPTQNVCLVGKGLTYDTGGLNLKPGASMLDMKLDMGGAAAVIGAMRAVAQLKPGAHVVGYLACVENGIGGNAYHPGDVIVSRKGITVEINNTDAEGRLALADTIHYAIEREKPDVLVDLATLTGACMIALGPTTAGLFSENDMLRQDLVAAGTASEEKYWHMPLDTSLMSQLKSTIADTLNTGKRYGGAITAALFLSQFVDGKTSWAHIDIAGPAMSEGTALVPKGGAGFAVRTLARWIKNL